MRNTKEAGDLGEAAVARYLRRKGYCLLGSQWRCRFGEVDLIARDRKGTVCFVEVKLRSSTAYGLPREFVTIQKQEKLKKTAACWLSQKNAGDAIVRFDVAEVYLGPQQEITKLEYLENAFM